VIRPVFMTANYVARETGWAMHGWGHGDRATNERFAPLDTYAERLDELLSTIRGLGFDTIDLWGAHLSPEWATDEHVSIARDALDRHGLAVNSYATWVGPSTIERACELALAVGTDLIGAGMSGDVAQVARVLHDCGVRLGVEIHPEKTPAEVLEKIEQGDGTIGTTVDTGWWATQGYDPVRAIEELGEHVFHVHLKDVVRRGEPHDTCRWGEGVVDAEACVRALRSIAYSGGVAIEHEPEHEDPTEDIRAMHAELKGWLA
jgi:sugar phosphate isomerase/epimerase